LGFTGGGVLVGRTTRSKSSPALIGDPSMQFREFKIQR